MLPDWSNYRWVWAIELLAQAELHRWLASAVFRPLDLPMPWHFFFGSD